MQVAANKKEVHTSTSKTNNATPKLATPLKEIEEKKNAQRDEKNSFVSFAPEIFKTETS